MTTIIGLDCATQAKKTGLARGTRSRARVTIDDVVLASEVEDVAATLASWIDGPTLLAVDAPLGWPQPLGRELAKHRAGAPLAASAHAMFRRHTDRDVHARMGKLPLEVGADRIARTAHAALALLAQLREQTGRPIDLAWSPRLSTSAAIEVYPSATLEARGWVSRGYKGDGAAAIANRRMITDRLAREVTLGVPKARLVGHDDRLDAALCIVAGADFLAGRCVPPPPELADVAAVEGWIWTV